MTNNSVFYAVGGLVIVAGILEFIPAKKQMIRSSSVGAAFTRDLQTATPVDSKDFETHENYDKDASFVDVSANETRSAAVSRRTSAYSSGFRFRLHWEKGYYWQESYEETWWCMSCGFHGHCKENEVMRLISCKKSNRADARFKVIETKKGDQFRVSGTDLCLERAGRKNVVLGKCKFSDKNQLFKGFKPGRKFDLKPVKDRNRRCLTQHHHPKAYEEIYAETCSKAHRTKTGYWVKY